MFVGQHFGRLEDQPFGRQLVRQVEGTEIPLLDDSPLLPGMQLSFEAAAARFVILTT